MVSVFGRSTVTAFVLVHGAFHGAWCWIKLQTALERRGHRVHALDMPGCGEDRTPLAHVKLDSYADRIVAALNAIEGKPVALIGHSLGTMAVSVAAERLPHRIDHLVFLGGCIPRNGMSMYSLLQLIDAPNEPIRPMPPPGDPWSALAQEPPLDRVVELYYNDCAPEDVAYAMSRLRPQANAPRVTPLTLTTDRFGSVPRSFIGGSLDKANTIARQRATLALDPCERVYSLPTGHSPFFSAPDELADLLCAL
jgi:pimeloyl-ACP methyl ester carboxylesterase